jgi:spore coat protein CotH
MMMPCRIAVALTALALTAGTATAQQKKKPKNDDLFGIDKVWTVHIKVSSTAWDEMHPKNPPKFGPGFPKDKGPAPKEGKGEARGLFGLDFAYVKGAVEINGDSVEGVGVRFKGNSTYTMTGPGLKKPFRIDLNHYNDATRYRGLSGLVLGNNAFDPSQLREALGYAVYREAGVVAPRTAFAKLYLTVEGKHDRKYLGLYTVIEPVNKAFLRRHLSAKGMLLKPEFLQVGPGGGGGGGGGGLPYLGEDWSAYEAGYRPKTDVKPEQAKRLIAFTKLIHRADDATFRKQIRDYLDVDATLRYVATTALMVNLDSLLGLGHNFYLYLDPKTNKFSFLPYDLNLAFAGFNFGGGAQTELSIRKPHFAGNRLIERLLAMKDVAAAYQKELERQSKTVFTKEKLLAHVAGMEKATAAAVAQEPKAAAPKFGMMGAAPDLKKFLADRTVQVALQIAGKSEGVQPGFGGPGFGGPGKGGPFAFGPGQMIAGALFRGANVDKDGKVTKKQLVELVEKIFKEADKDGKGAVDQKALADALNRLLPQQFGPPGMGPGQPPFGPPGGQPPGKKEKKK